MPALFLWPGTLKPGVVMEMGAFFDLLPTFAALAGVPMPSDRVLDGYDLTPVLRSTGPSPRRTYFYYRGSLLQAVRSGAFKLHFFTRPEGHDKVPERVDPPWLFNLDHDPSEQFDVARDHPRSWPPCSGWPRSTRVASCRWRTRSRSEAPRLQCARPWCSLAAIER